MEYYNYNTCEVKYVVEHFKKTPQRILLHELVNLIGENCRFYIYGGYIRDLMIEYFYKIQLQKKDIDIIVDSDVPIEPCLKGLPGFIGKTSLGGIRWYPTSKNNLYVDIWRIQKNINIVIQNIKPTIENAIKGPVFNLNRICFDLKKKN